jgi:succinyl-CoA synthetase alpha subunit
MATTLAFKRLPNLYKDSVALMQLAATLRAREGVAEASAVMATPANLAQLADADLAIEGLAAAPSDLLVVVRGEPAACEAALAAAETQLKAPARSTHGTHGTHGAAGAAGGGSPAEPAPTSLAMGLERVGEGGADLALISVPGDYAAAEAHKALALGLDVMLFSDNVSLDEERTLKAFAHERGLLVMGPDCGTAIVNGVPLGFANVVRRGDIGLVAASGTGLQEVTCRIHNGGGGISQALGTGGRDLHEGIGGITMLQGLAALAADEGTRVIVLVSKPPAPAIALRIEQAAAAVAAAGKPVVVHFLGSAPASVRATPRLHVAASLHHAGDMALALARGQAVPARPAAPPGGVLATLATWARDLPARQWQLRGLFTGGTFCYEAQLAFAARGIGCSSNAPAPGVAAWHGRPDAPADRAHGHVLLDLGDDDFTRGRAHPMIDPTLRDAAVRAMGADAGAAALLFDIVLGYGAHDDPAASLVEAMAAAQATAHTQGRRLAFIGHVCGTYDDPQSKAAQMAKLEAAGALVLNSNAEAAEAAAHLAAALAARAGR